MDAPIVVLDINGVLADVRRREEPAVIGRVPDVVLPNGQRAYMRPGSDRLFTWLRGQNIQHALFTSRYKRNAAPIEDWMRRSYLHYGPVACLYGEDCTESVPEEQWRPKKTCSVARACSRELAASRLLIFVDDHPERLGGMTAEEGAECVPVCTYDAQYTNDWRAMSELRDATWAIGAILGRAIKKMSAV